MTTSLIFSLTSNEKLATPDNIKKSNKLLESLLTKTNENSIPISTGQVKTIFEVFGNAGTVTDIVVQNQTSQMNSTFAVFDKMGKGSLLDVVEYQVKSVSVGQYSMDVMKIPAEEINGGTLGLSSTSSVTISFPNDFSMLIPKIVGSSVSYINTAFKNSSRALPTVLGISLFSEKANLLLI